MARNSDLKKVRVQLDFSNEAYEELTQLQRETGAPSMVETVRYSLRTLQFITEALHEGAFILVEKNGKQQNVVFPFITRRVVERETVQV